MKKKQYVLCLLTTSKYTPIYVTSCSLSKFSFENITSLDKYPVILQKTSYVTLNNLLCKFDKKTQTNNTAPIQIDKDYTITVIIVFLLEKTNLFLYFIGDLK